MRILVGVPTFKRPESLSRTLESLKYQECVDFDVCVIDNDRRRSAESTASAFKMTLSLRYETEERPGVVHVRNRLLELATQYDGLAFIDDDEEASPNWISELKYAASLFPGAVIAGQVQYAPSGPLEQDPVLRLAYSRPARTKGQLIANTGTGNCFIPTSALSGDEAPLFDQKFARSGGEDTHYFNRLVRNGVEIRWWPDAEVLEHLPIERRSHVAAIKKFRRAGYVNALIELESSNATAVFARYGARVILAHITRITMRNPAALAKATARLHAGLGGLAATRGAKEIHYGND